jgi:hypothetical protein
VRIKVTPFSLVLPETVVLKLRAYRMKLPASGCVAGMVLSHVNVWHQKRFKRLAPGRSAGWNPGSWMEGLERYIIPKNT